MVVTSIDMVDVIIAFSAKRCNWGCRTLEHCDKAMLALRDSAKLGLDAAFHPDGYNVGINDGEAAGQTVPHLHLHLIPRYAGDREDPRGGVRWILPQKAKYWP
jgi:diadenosine tetraphosphate (Ap4A) HIT family hydrolase